MSLLPVDIFAADLLTALHEQSFDCPWTKTQFESLLKLPTTMGWMTEKGLILCAKILDEMEILTFCVSPDYRKRGLGRELLEKLCRFAEQNNVKTIFLEVDATNAPAINLYRKTGFVPTGKRAGYYHIKQGITHDALLFEKQIKCSSAI